MFNPFKKFNTFTEYLSLSETDCFLVPIRAWYESCVSGSYIASKKCLQQQSLLSTIMKTLSNSLQLIESLYHCYSSTYCMQINVVIVTLNTWGSSSLSWNGDPVAECSSGTYVWVLIGTPFFSHSRISFLWWSWANIDWIISSIVSVHFLNNNN